MRYKNKRICKFIGLKILEIGGVMLLLFMGSIAGVWVIENIFDEEMCTKDKIGTIIDKWSWRSYECTYKRYIIDTFIVGAVLGILFLLCAVLSIGLFLFLAWALLSKWFKWNWEIAGRLK